MVRTRCAMEHVHCGECLVALGAAHVKMWNVSEGRASQQQHGVNLQPDAHNPA